jgi:ankyrin repeat protein
MRKLVVVTVVLAALVALALTGCLSTKTPTTDFFELVITGTPQDVQAAITNGADVNARDKDGKTPLISAAQTNKNPEVITTLLKADADIEARDLLYTGTALMWAANNNRNPEVITTLLKAGADIEVRSQGGGTALMWAAGYNRNPEVITTLLKAGADINAKDNSGGTALMAAAERNPNPEVITALLKAGADAKAKNKVGQTAFEKAKYNEDLKGTDALKQLEETSK